MRPPGMPRWWRTSRRRCLRSRTRGGVEEDLRRDMEADAERRGIIEADASNGEEMAEEALEGDTRRREEAEARIRVAT